MKPTVSIAARLGLAALVCVGAFNSCTRPPPAIVAPPLVATTPSPAHIELPDGATRQSTSITLVEVKGNGNKVVRHTVDLATFLPFGGIDNCKILHASRDIAHQYYVLDIEAVSRPESQGNGGCGTGIEGLVIWLQFDRDKTAPSGIQGILFQSCWNDHYGTLKEGATAITVTDVSLGGVTTTQFIRAQPSAGLVRLSPDNASNAAND